LACALLTGVLAWFTRAALRERSYSAVMAATGLSYLAILMGFGTDLIARALLVA
jgi:CHASE2 domain-containing sensor protein